MRRWVFTKSQIRWMKSGSSTPWRPHSGREYGFFGWASYSAWFSSNDPPPGDDENMSLPTMSVQPSPG